MTTRKDNNIDVIPRISVLEKSQEAIARDLISLSHSVKSQGEQLTAAILSLSQTQNANYNALAEKIGANNLTDWTSFWSMVGVVLILVGMLLAPAYLMNTFNNEKIQDLKERISKTEETLHKRLPD